jgi:hypothetical protein
MGGPTVVMAASRKRTLILSKYPSSGDDRDGLSVKPPIGSFFPEKPLNAKSWIRLSRPSHSFYVQVDFEKFPKIKEQPIP